MFNLRHKFWMLKEVIVLEHVTCLKKYDIALTESNLDYPCRYIRRLGFKTTQIVLGYLSW